MFFSSSSKSRKLKKRKKYRKIPNRKRQQRITNDEKQKGNKQKLAMEKNCDKMQRVQLHFMPVFSNVNCQHICIRQLYPLAKKKAKNKHCRVYSFLFVQQKRQVFT